MAGSRADYDAAQYRQKRRVRAELWLRKQNTKTHDIYIFLLFTFFVFALVCALHALKIMFL